MGAITDRITEFIRNLLQSWVMSNLEGMFTYVNEKTADIAGEVSKTPGSWNAGIFSMVRDLSDTVVVPIAGLVITYVLCYELVTMVIDRNNMHEFDTSLFFRYLFKACIAVMLLSSTSDIVLAVFDVGGGMVNSAGSVIAGTTDIDLSSTLQQMFIGHVDGMETGELVGLGLETMVVSLCMKVMSVLITVILYGRMVEIYLYISIAPLPFATLTNREWGRIGTNYVKGAAALALQGFFIMVCVAAYAALVAGISVASNLHTAIWSSAGYTVLLCFALMKTGSLSRSVLNAH